MYTYLESLYRLCLILEGWNFEDYVHDLGNNVIKRDKHPIIYMFLKTLIDLLALDSSFIQINIYTHIGSGMMNSNTYP